jgi:sulfopyruvate decarboxylase TPP-binding subunit
MDQEAIRLAVEAFKEEQIDLVVTVPEEPTHTLILAVKEDPYFRTITAPSEGCAIVMCAAASLSGRRCVFITGIAGLLVGAWALSQMGPTFSVPLFIMAAYRGDVGDRSGIPGTMLDTFRQVGEPVLNGLRISYRIVDEKRKFKRMIRDTHYASVQNDTPFVLLLTGEVLW